MNRKIAFILSVVFLVNLFGMTVVSAQNICVFNTPEIGEFFSETSIFEVSVSAGKENAEFNLSMRGLYRPSHCEITLFDSEGDFAVSALDTTTKYTKRIDAIPEPMLVSDFRGGVRHDFVNEQISEKPFSVKINKPKSGAKKYFVVISTNNCEVMLDNITENLCEVKKVSESDYDLINTNITSAYYNCVVVKPMYLFPESVKAYIAEYTATHSSAPFSEYKESVESKLPDSWVEKLEHNIFNGIINFFDGAEKIVMGEIKNTIDGLIYNTDKLYDTYDLDDLKAEYLEETYLEILESMLTQTDKTLIEIINKSDEMKFYKGLSKTLKTAKSKADFENLEIDTNASVYGRLFDKLEELKPLDEGLKWWQIGEDFVASMLMAYDSKMAYIDALDKLYADSMGEPHKQAIEEIKKKYSDSFAERLVKACDDSGLFDELIGKSIDEVEKLIAKEYSAYFNFSNFLTVTDIAIKLAFRIDPTLAEIKENTSMINKISWSNGICTDAIKTMKDIQSKYNSGREITDDDAKMYACMFDIAKATRVYQFEAIKKTYGGKEKKDIEAIITEIKGMYINYTDETGLTSPEAAPADKSQLEMTLTPGSSSATAIYTFNNGFYNREGIDLDISEVIEYSMDNTACILISSDKNKWTRIGDITSDYIDLSSYDISEGAHYKYVKVIIETNGDIPKFLDNESCVKAYYIV